MILFAIKSQESSRLNSDIFFIGSYLRSLEVQGHWKSIIFVCSSFLRHPAYDASMVLRFRLLFGAFTNFAQYYRLLCWGQLGLLEPTTENQALD